MWTRDVLLDFYMLYFEALHITYLEALQYIISSTEDLFV